MKFKYVFLIFSVVCLQSNLLAQNKKLKTRMDRAINIAYETYDYDLEKIKINKGDIPEKVSTDFSKDKIFKVQSKGKNVGYAYMGQAPSKERDFDYLVMFDPDLKVLKAKVLIYREKFGHEISSTRWLRQFEGMTPSSSPEYKDNIDGISGATISAKSMTRAMNKVLNTMGRLNNSNLL